MGRKAKDDKGEKPFEKNPEIAAQIEHNASPEPDQHNEGQPIRQQLNDRGQQMSKMFTDCQIQQRESLKCIEENYTNKGVCQPFFDAYKQCRHEEHKKRLEENLRLSGGDNANDSGCTIS